MPSCFLRQVGRLRYRFPTIHLPDDRVQLLARTVKRIRIAQQVEGRIVGIDRSIRIFATLTGLPLCRPTMSPKAARVLPAVAA